MLKYSKLFAILSLFTCIFASTGAVASEAPPEEDSVVIVEPTSAPVIPVEPMWRGAALLNYSYFDMIVPGKYGASIEFSRAAKKSWELEYLKSSLSAPFFIADLGSMSDERLSLSRRSYVGTSTGGFNLSYGLTYFRFSARIGDDLMSRLSGGQYPSVDLIEIQSIGFNLSFGNRWLFKHGIVFGVDWISWYQPVYNFKREAGFLTYVSDEGDREKVDMAVKIASYVPHLAFLKLQLGFHF